MTCSDITVWSWNSPAPLAGNAKLYLSRSVSESRSPTNSPVDYRIWDWWRDVCTLTHGCHGVVLGSSLRVVVLVACYKPKFLIIYLFTLLQSTRVLRHPIADKLQTISYITSTTHWPIITRSARWRSPASWDVAAAPVSGPVNQCYTVSHRRCCRSALRYHYFPSMPLTMGKHITKRHRRSSWSMKKAITCKHVGKITSIWTSAELKPALFRANTLHNRLLSDPQRVCTEENTLFRVISIAAI